MRIRGSPAHLMLVVGLLLLHFLLRPTLVQWPMGPDLLTGALLLAAFGLRAGSAAVLGLVLGLLEASMALAGMGTLILIYGSAGFLAARARDLLFSDSPRFVPTFLFVGVWLVQLLTAVAIGARIDLRFALLHAPLAALSTAIVCWLGERTVSYLLRA